MVVDRQGQTYVGDFGFDVLKGETAKPASIILVQPDRGASVVARDLKSPNGSIVTPVSRKAETIDSIAVPLTAMASNVMFTGCG